MEERKRERERGERERERERKFRKIQKERLSSKNVKTDSEREIDS